LITKCVSAGVLTGVWLERGAKLIEPKSGVPTSVSHHRDKETFQMRVMIGIDPHKATHTAVAIDDSEVMLDELRVRACNSQVTRLRSWAEPYEDRVWAIESARGLGYLLAQQLVAAGETVIDVPAVLSTRTRLLGSGRAQKNDPNDARSVAITAMRVDGLQRVSADEHAQVLKLLAKRHRDLGRLKSKAACRLHALLMELLPGGMAKEMTVNRANALLDQVVDHGQITQHRVEVAREFVADVAHYETQMKASMKRLGAAVAATGTSLTDIRGIGVVTAAMIIGQTGDVSRFASAGHFASYNATAPIEASSGEHRRHRLNPRGNRQLNYAIHIAAITQLRYPCPGREYYDRRCSEGKNTKEAIRALKRHISNAVYRALVADARRLDR
jgi:transposase